MVLKTNDLEELPIVRRDGAHSSSPVVPTTNLRLYSHLKFLLGWPLALVLLLLAAPLIVLMAVAVKLTSRGPAFYSQVRQGRSGRPYRMYKIRTMVVNSEARGPQWAKPDDPRVTLVGRLLRKTHLDELPQLVNVLKGEMSLVGPRPERPEFAHRLEQAVPHYRDRLLVRPGVTGLAQIHLPADTDLKSVRRKLAHDLYYIGHMNPWLDLRLLICTGLYLVRVPFHISARMLRVPGGRRVERLFPALRVRNSAAPHFAAADLLDTRRAEPFFDTVAEEMSETPSGELGPLEPGRTHVSVVVPCFNEEPALGQLAETMASVETHLGGQYDLHWLLVDDGSTDATWPALKEHFDDWPNVKLLQHARNRGVAAAIRTGIEAANTEAVCSIDADCTYDPHMLREMIPLLRTDVALVTASPYHALGQVFNVPRWRLFLSRGASYLYGLALRQKLSTYTSCFRVYRRSAVLPLELSEDGFEGVAELLARVDLQGHRVVEFPATLSVRRVGRSKMRIVRAIWGHLRLLVRISWLRWRCGAAPAPTVEVTPAVSNPISLERTSA